MCGICQGLEGVELGMDDGFQFKGRQLFAEQNLMPPAHPRCACAVEYIEVEGALFRQESFVEYEQNNFTNEEEYATIDTRNMANGMRKSYEVPLSDSDKEFIYREIAAIEADTRIFVFRDFYPTGYSDERDIIYVSSSVFPPNDGSINPTDLLSVRATLAHEYYGHRQYRGTKVKNGAWNDEFRASYMAAKNCPNLTDEDRVALLNDAVYRARKAGISIKNNKFMLRILYGYE